MNEYDNNINDNVNDDGQWKTAEEWRQEEETHQKKKGFFFRRNKKDNSGERPERTGKGRGYWVKVGATAIVFGLVAGVAFEGVQYGFSRAGIGSSGTQLATTKTSSGSSSSSSSGISQVAENAMPAIVSITSIYENTSQGWFGQQQSSQSEGAGSGVIIGKEDNKLLIVTNNHVVEDADSLSVGFVDGETADASVRGTDSDADLAVVEVNLSDMKDSTQKEIAIITMGDSDELKAGEQAIAIGNALGYGQSVTGGYISAVNREVQMTDNTMTLIQTDAAINPGNSGGALLNSKGELIGINTVKYSSTDVEGMGYAIPINTAKPIIEQLIANEAPSEDEQSYLGISGQTVDSSMASQFDMPTGVYVQQVVSGSPAETAGISAGDIITKFNGSTVSTMDGLQSRMSNLKAGTKVEVVVQRQNQQGTYESKTVTVTLGKKSDAPSTSSSDSSSGNSGSSRSQNGSVSGYGSYYSR